MPYLIPFFYDQYKHVAKGPYEFVVLAFRIRKEIRDIWKKKGMIVVELPDDVITYHVLSYNNHYFKAQLLKLEALQLINYQQVRVFNQNIYIVFLLLFSRFYISIMIYISLHLGILLA